MEKVLRELQNIVLAKPLDFLLWKDGKLELKELKDIPKKSRGAAGTEILDYRGKNRETAANRFTATTVE